MIDTPRYTRENIALLIAGSIIFACLLIAISGCSEPAPTTGQVTDKRFNAAHWEGGFETCSFADTWTKWECDEQGDTYWEDHDEWVNDSWDLKLRKCETDDKGKEKCSEGWREVSEQDFNRHGLNDFYPKTDEHAGDNP